MSCLIKKSGLDYPPLLQAISDPPDTLYYKGKLTPGVFDNCLAVVGTRSSSSYGEKAVKKILRELSSEITVVSGFMTGIDAVAHRCAIDRGLKTVAVMPCGVSQIFPWENRHLYNSILESGNLLVSEYSDDTTPKKWTFVRRNRLVAGIARCVLVVEAALKSGSLQTAGFAKTYSRKLCAVPGSIFSELSAGPHKIIVEGGEFIENGDQINKLMGFEHLSCSGTRPESSEDAVTTQVLNLLKASGWNLEELLTATELNKCQLNTILVQLELEDKVVSRFGRYYAC